MGITFLFTSLPIIIIICPASNFYDAFFFFGALVFCLSPRFWFSFLFFSFLQTFSFKPFFFLSVDESWFSHSIPPSHLIPLHGASFLSHAEANKRNIAKTWASSEEDEDFLWLPNKKGVEIHLLEGRKGEPESLWVSQVIHSNECANIAFFLWKRTGLTVSRKTSSSDCHLSLLRHVVYW